MSHCGCRSGKGHHHQGRSWKDLGLQHPKPLVFAAVEASNFAVKSGLSLILNPSVNGYNHRLSAASKFCEAM
jgi:hypothetical protein